MFTQTVAGITQSLESLGSVSSATQDRDTAERVTRLIIENGLENAVAAFQRCVEAMYSDISSALTARRNAFQNLAEGNQLWRAAAGESYRDHLSEDELNRTDPILPAPPSPRFHARHR